MGADEAFIYNLWPSKASSIVENSHLQDTHHDRYNAFLRVSHTFIHYSISRSSNPTSLPSNSTILSRCPTQLPALPCRGHESSTSYVNIINCRR